MGKESIEGKHSRGGCNSILHASRNLGLHVVFLVMAVATGCFCASAEAADAGVFKTSFKPAQNHLAGKWTLEVQELLTGKNAKISFMGK